MVRGKAHGLDEARDNILGYQSERSGFAIVGIPRGKTGGMRGNGRAKFVGVVVGEFHHLNAKTEESTTKTTPHAKTISCGCSFPWVRIKLISASLAKDRI